MSQATHTLFLDAHRGARRIRACRLAPEGRRPDWQRFAQAQLRLGSRDSNDFVVTGQGVSRQHAELVATAHGYLLRDLGSANGTWVNGMRVLEAYLPERAELQLGQARLRFEALDDSEALPSSENSRWQLLLGSSAPMRELFASLEQVAATDATVLIEGESGTGKELVARSIHAASPRAAGPCVVFDCAAVPPNLIESALFGHERGAFTGADRARRGALEEADGGTLFLDELGELPLELQPRLLRALESRQVQPVGSNQARAVDLRVVAATNREMLREVNAGRFREDLYFRLAVVTLQLPALRERPEDIPLLVTHFVERAGLDRAKVARLLQGLTPEQWQALQRAHWRGNVRELRNAVTRALTLCGDGPLDFTLHSSAAAVPEAKAEAPGIDLAAPFSEQKAQLVAHFERSYLEAQLARHGGNISQAAQAAGLDRMYFKRLLNKHR